MTNPITPSGPGPGPGVPLHEAVLRHGATQELREQKRVEVAVTNDKEALPLDQAILENTSAVADGPSKSVNRAPVPHAHHHHAHDHGAEAAHAQPHGVAEEHAPHERPEDVQTREAVAARFAAEQQGKQEMHRQGRIVAQRSTREMVQRMEEVRETAECPAAEPQRAEATQDSSRQSAAPSPPATPTAPGNAAAGANAQVANAAAHEVGAHIGEQQAIAAAVRSGVVPSEHGAGAHGTTHRRIWVDTEFDGQGDKYRTLDPKAKKVGRHRSMDQNMSFNGGGHQDDPRQNRKTWTDSRGMQNRDGGASSGGDGDGGEQPRGQTPAVEGVPAEDPPPVSAASEAMTHDGTTAAAVAAADTERREAASLTAAVEAGSMRSVAGIESEQRQATREIVIPVYEKTVDTDCASGDDTLDWTQVQQFGLDLMSGDEYFFFDDAQPKV